MIEDVVNDFLSTFSSKEKVEACPAIGQAQYLKCFLLYIDRILNTGIRLQAKQAIEQAYYLRELRVKAY